ncbi:Eukaryotic membrane protein family [Leishmania braziliensis]|nr:Eukaryotic membrane protein family [Leishmania braziliensis]
MWWKWGTVRRQTIELLLGPTAEQRHHQLQHRDQKQAYETFMTMSASAASEPRRSGGSESPDSSPPATVGVASAGGRHRNHEYATLRKHFQRIPHMFLNMEFYFAITALGLFDHLIGLLLLPLKVLTLWRRCELRDIIALLVLTIVLGSYWVAGLATTQLYSYLYHAVRRTSFIKVVMIFGILDVVDKILSSFSQDSLEVLYTAVDDEYSYYCARRRQAKPPAASTPTKRAASGRGYAGCDDVGTAAASQHTPPSRWLLAGSGVVACLSTSCHSLSLLLHVVTLNVAINAEGNSLLALLVANNFTELKGVLFKKNTPESLHGVSSLDALERMQYIVFFFVMLLQHMHERFTDFAIADVCIILCVEVAIDFVKHLFVFRFNGIPPSMSRAYSQLALLDLSCETVLWRLPSLEVVVSGPSSSVATRMEEAAELLTPAHGFAPKHVKRAGFDAIAYAALLLWSCERVAGYLLLQAPLVCVLLVLILALLKVMLSSIVYGVCARFTLRSLVVVPPSWPPSPSQGSVPPPLNGASQRTSVSLTSPLVSACGVRLGVSPINTPHATPIGGSRHFQIDAATFLPANSKSGPEAVRTLVQLTPLLLALLKANRFDLHAGKAKRSH